MRHVAARLCAVVMAVASAAQPVSAQGFGWVVDKIFDWSGPRMRYLGGTFRIGYQPGQRIDSATFAQLDSCRGLSLGSLDANARNTVTERFGSLQNIVNRNPRQHIDESLVDALRDDAAEIRDLSDPARVEACTGMLERLVSTPINEDRYHGWQWRLGIFFGDDRKTSDPNAIRGFMVEPSLEYRVGGIDGASDVGIEIGLSAHRLYGGIDDPFWHLTVPVSLNVHPFPRCESWLLRNVRGGLGFHIVPGFDRDAFAPHVYNNIEDDELTFAYFVAWDFSLSSKVVWPPWKGCF